MNKNKCRCECIKINLYENNYVWNPTTCACENRKHLACIMHDSAVICDEVTKSYDKEIKVIPTNFNKKECDL